MHTMVEEKQEMIPFMDTFYYLSSNDPSERSKSASSLLHHIFFSNDTSNEENSMEVEEGGEESQKKFDALIKDGCYAFTRLLNGLCSGRASARQGYASCFTSFLKLSFQIVPSTIIANDDKKIWIDYFMANMKGDNNINNNQSDSSISGFVRKVLLEHTSVKDCITDRKGNTKRAKKGSEERDHMFGQLFGILAVIRSETLTLDQTETSLETLKGYILDLVALYNLKKWIREPAAHGIKEMLSFASKRSLDTVAKLLLDNEIKSFFSTEGDMTAEKISLYLHLQATFSGREMPDVISKPILTVASFQGAKSEESIQLILRDTSSVVYPRCHMVWESVWSYLCEKKKSQKSGKRLAFRKKCPVGEESPSTILQALVNTIIVDSLLTESDANNVTHERRALAMSLILQLCQQDLPPQVIEKVILHPTIISKLFIQTLQKHSKDHILKPLALKILGDIVETLCIDGKNLDRRLAVIKSLLQSNPSFDAITQTETVCALLGFSKDRAGFVDNDSTSHDELWKSYLSFLQKELFEKLTCDDGAHEALKFVDLMCNFAKKVAHVGSDEIRQHVFRRTSSILEIGAFFDLSNFTTKISNCDENSENIEFIAKSIAKELKQKNVLVSIPHDVRLLMSSRFFSLVSDYIATDKRGKSRSLKMNLIIAEISQIQSTVETLKSCGAKLVNEGTPIDDKESDYDGMLPFEASLKISRGLREAIAVERNEVKSHALSAMFSLLLSLSLQILHPGQPDIEQDPDEEVDDIDEVFDEVLELMGDLSDIAGDFNKKLESVGDGEEEENPLCSLAIVCVNVLNSSIGGSTANQCPHLLGGSRLVRDCIQIAWGCMLNIHQGDDSSSSKLLNEDVMSVILESICSPDAFSDPVSVSEDNEDIEMDENNEESSDENMGAFTEANKSGIDVEDMDIDKQNDQDDSDSDIELDPSSLENMLLQDRDEEEDVGALEHHSGADAALAQLIKLRQDSRKAGQNKKEKIDLSNRARCFSLLEAVFTSNRRNTVSNKIILLVILPLIRTRSILKKSLVSIENSVSNKNNSSIAEKRALIDRITKFFDSQLSKTHVHRDEISLEACQTLSKQIVSEMKTVSSPDQCKLCSSLLLIVLKAIGGNTVSEISKSLAEVIYVELVQNWSKKKNSHLHSFIFDDFISTFPTIAKQVLTKEVVIASQVAQSTYLKAESFRILATLYSIKVDDNDDAKLSLKDSSTNLSYSLVQALADSELTKAKRIREILKATEKLIEFSHAVGDTDFWSQASTLVEPLQKLRESSGSSTVKSQCQAIEKNVQDGIKKNQITLQDVTSKKEAINTVDSSAKKDKKKKKKGKKKK